MEEHGVEMSSIMQIGTGEDEVDLSNLTREGSIFRIPALHKMRNEQTYTPYKFSIGPWHFGKTQSLRTERKLKESFLEGLTERFPNPNAKKRELVEAIQKVHDKARYCYEGGDVYDEGKFSDATKEKFEEILLLDGCFIIELFRKHAEKVVTRDNELALFSQGMIQVIYHDLLLLENQIPWFVLQLLFHRTRTSDDNHTLSELAIKFFERAISQYETQGVTWLQSRHDSNITHLVDLMWHFFCFIPGADRKVKKLEYRTLIPSATRLKEAGVKFQRAESSNILDVTFNEGVLKIPPLLITPSTETIFRNFIIFEQCSILLLPRVTCYAILLDCLVDTSDDVDLMSRAGILNNW